MPERKVVLPERGACGGGGRVSSARSRHGRIRRPDHAQLSVLASFCCRGRRVHAGDSGGRGVAQSGWQRAGSCWIVLLFAQRDHRSARSVARGPCYLSTRSPTSPSAGKESPTAWASTVGLVYCPADETVQVVLDHAGFVDPHDLVGSVSDSARLAADGGSRCGMRGLVEQRSSSPGDERRDGHRSKIGNATAEERKHDRSHSGRGSWKRDARAGHEIRLDPPEHGEGERQGAGQQGGRGLLRQESRCRAATRHGRSFPCIGR